LKNPVVFLLQRLENYYDARSYHQGESYLMSSIHSHLKNEVDA
jgi:hypothetical protein